MDKDALCPCCSGKTYESCCEPYHKGLLPDNALQLMRSRYCAYALNLPDYIIETTDPLNPHYSKNTFSWRRSIIKFSTHSIFQKLEILDFQENGSLATVTFTAHLLQGTHDATFTEKSLFEKVDGRWLYKGCG